MRLISRQRSRSGGGASSLAEGGEHLAVEPLVVIGDRHVVDGGDVERRDDGALAHIAEQRELAPVALRDRPVAAHQQDVRLDADRAQLLDRVLRRLGLQLAGGGDVGHQRQVDVDRVAARQLVAELADRLEERQALDVADRAADLAEHEVEALVAVEDERLDGVGDVRDHLHGAAEIVAAPLLGDDLLVDAAGGDVVLPVGGAPGEALVMAEVEVGLRPVVGDEDLAVLVGAHRPRIDVQIGVELAQPDLVAARLQQRAERRRCETLAEGGDHAAGDEDVPRHGIRALARRHRFDESKSARRASSSAALSAYCAGAARRLRRGRGPRPEPRASAGAAPVPSGAAGAAGAAGSAGAAAPAGGVCGPLGCAAELAQQLLARSSAPRRSRRRGRGAMRAAGRLPGSRSRMSDGRDSSCARSARPIEVAKKATARTPVARVSTLPAPRPVMKAPPPAADAERAAFGALQQHEADHGQDHHQVDHDDDSRHESLSLGRAFYTRRRVALKPQRAGRGADDGEEIRRFQAGAADQPAIHVRDRQDRRGIVGLHRPAVEDAHRLVPPSPKRAVEPARIWACTAAMSASLGVRPVPIAQTGS